MFVTYYNSFIILIVFIIFKRKIHEYISITVHNIISVFYFFEFTKNFNRNNL